MGRLRRVAGKSVYRTPDARFTDLPDYPFAPHYIDIDDARLGPLRMHYIDENPTAGNLVLLLHGEPSWSYLYRLMIRDLAAAGVRVVAPDLIGFGRSDKPGSIGDFSYAGHVDWLRRFIAALDLSRVTLFCQDWGGLLGLRAVAAEPARFARLAIANTALPDGTIPLPPAFIAWRRFARWSPYFPIGKIIDRGSVRPLSAAERAAYDAPFPNRRYKAGSRAFPRLVPGSVDEPAAMDNRAAWRILETFERPVLTLFSDRDPITRGGERIIQRRVPGAFGQPHQTMRDAGHFLQEDAGPALAEAVLAFIERA